MKFLSLILINTWVFASDRTLHFAEIESYRLKDNNTLEVSYKIDCNQKFIQVIRKDINSDPGIVQVNLGVLLESNNLMDCNTQLKIEHQDAGSAYSGIRYEVKKIYH